MLTVAYCSIPGNGFGKAVAAEATLFRTTLQLTPLNTAFLPPMRVTNWIAEWASPSSARGRQIGEILRQQTADLICITEGEGRSCHRPKELSGVRSKASASAYEVVAQHPELKSLVARK